MTKNKLILSFVGLLFLLAGAGAGVYLVQQQQLLQKDAAWPGGTATIRMAASKTNVAVGDTVDVDIYFTTPEPVTGITMQLKYEYNPTLSLPPLMSSSDQISIDAQLLNRSNNWAFQVKNFRYENGVATVGISGFTGLPDGYVRPGETKLATIRFTATGNSQARLYFDPEQTILQADANDNDIFLTPTSEAIITVGSGTTPTVAPTNPPQPTTPPNPTSGPNPTSAPSPTTPPGTSPAPTTPPGSSPAPTQATGPTTSVVITSPRNGATLTDTTPTFTGTSPANATIQAEINANPAINGSTVADGNGRWTWTAPSPLALGAYTATIRATNATNNTTSASVNFTIASASALPTAGNASATLWLLALGILLLLGGTVFLAKPRIG
jgi:hypothetical protein